ncbi:helix-turn-helix domain-containing protein [Pedobacter nototheniae]|uniref:helix-turn-helix domain-containing protein n=1 Tax=Pedobacter nototheniae TaxID=2488994 RepID=UPI001039374E|nr:helix-turn-helix domain-containing protein [Pedobacter nototheniae]
MKNGYYSLSGSFRINPNDLAKIFELYANGQSIDAIAQAYSIGSYTIERHIRKYYEGIIPKELQERVTLDSKANYPDGIILRQAS